jgi:Acyl-CoA oxidase.
LKGEVIGILDAIAPPDGVLNSPIGSSDGDIYNRFINTVWSAPRAFEKPYYWKEIHHKN